ncbi:disease resistance protein RPP8-like [Eucalyptus grandis]|uniref:disease resistance protein RPP8-like n=1 Tax=Eucalyptus grandis TaxID=71139 RepID=UPI00192F0ACD|nr:disease resistance protein RPP8-like [Eucalyptus grandis]
MAEFAVSSVVKTIGNLLTHEARFLRGVEGKMEDLQKELKLIQGLLRDADARVENDQAVGEWVAQLRDVAWHAEDIIEEYILRVAPKKEQYIVKAYRGLVAKCSCLQVHAVETEIDSLKSKISNLRMSMLNHGIQMVNEGERKRTRASASKPIYAYFEEYFVGREDSVQELVKELLKDGEQHRVITIWGMSGLGKTSLAKKVLAHDKLKNNFDGFAWACVSQVYHSKDILVKILIELIPNQRENVKEMMDDELFKALYEIQLKKRCIVVLDNIWAKEAWDSLQAAFPVKGTRSKLLITTHNREVAEHIDPHGLFHKPRFLSNEESWDLLKKRASLETKVMDENMKMLGYKLLEKCGGLPLAVNVLGGLLADTEWETIYKDINSHFGDKSDIFRVLALSYDNLPQHLKPYFLYLGSFPENTEIPATKVLQMWIAEGFVSPNPYDEDVAEQYLMKFANRGMVQVRFTLSGKIKSCCLHNLMRDICICKARQEKFLTILENQQDNEIEDYFSSSSMAIGDKSTWKTRRLSLNMLMSDSRVRQKENNVLHLRAIMFFNSREWVWKQFEDIIINCKFLRVLKLEGMIGNLPESVGDLVRLRYLSLEGCMLEDLPQSMGNLVCMEYLDLQGLEHSKVNVPNVLWKMRRLRHLHLPKYFAENGQKNLRLDSLENLQTLRNFNPEHCNVNDLGKLTNLRKIIVSLQYGSYQLKIIPQLAHFTFKHLQSSSFEILNQIRSFTENELSNLSSYHLSCKLFIKGGIEKLPEYKNLPQQLRKLVLLDSQLKEDPMPTLEKLNDMVVLQLMNRAFVGKEMICSAGGFPQLKHLVLHDLPNLEEWRVAEGAMPHLSKLGVSGCPKLKTVPGGVYKYDSSIGDHFSRDEHLFQQDEHWQQIVMTRSFLINVSIAPLLARRINVRDLV